MKYRHPVICLLLLCAPLVAQEGTTWVGGGGQWFEKQNWTLGVPNKRIPASIPEGEVVVFPGEIDPSAASLDVGSGGDANFLFGTLSVEGHDLVIDHSLHIANTFRESSIGKVELLGDAARGGNLSVNDLNIGRTNGKAGSAEGSLNMTGSIFVNIPEQRMLNVGLNARGGSAFGSMEVGGSIGGPNGGFQNVTIGELAGSFGEAVGTVHAQSLHTLNGQLVVGSNVGTARDSHASGNLTVDNLSGFGLVIVGQSEIGQARGTIHIGESYQADETVIGPQNGQGVGILSMSHGAEFNGGKVTVNRSGHFNMSGRVDAEVVSSGRIAVQNRPDGSPGGRVIMSNVFTQFPTGILELDVAGPTAGLGYEQVFVADGGSLQGRIHLKLSDSFQPQAGQTLQVVTGPVASDDLGWLISNAPDNLAVRFPETANGVVAQFVQPTSQTFVNLPVTDVDWTDPKAWSRNETPSSLDDLQLINSGSRDQLVQAARGSMARSLRIDGDTHTMTVRIPRGASLSATHGVEVKSGGQVLLENGSLLADQIDLSAGAALRGRGEIVGNVVNQGLLSVADSGEPGQLTIRGDFTQVSQGWLELDVLGIESGEFDQLIVDGAIHLNGTLSLNLPDLDRIGFDQAIPLFSATGGIFGDIDFQFENLVGDIPLGLLQRSGPDGGSTMMLISGSGPGILGDMNWDGFVDECDIDAFALSLQDEDAYTDLYIFSPAHIGDVSADGDFDVDDIQPFFELVNGTGCVGEALPEPTSNQLATMCIIAALTLRVRRRPT